MNTTKVNLNKLTNEYLRKLSNEELRAILKDVSAEVCKALDVNDKKTTHYFMSIHYQIRQHITY